jgi:hypothetical protein
MSPSAEVPEGKETRRETFEDMQASVARLLDKYSSGAEQIQKKYPAESKRTSDRIQQYRQIEASLLERMKADPSQRAVVTAELRQVIDEIGDALTHGTHIRALYPRRNRFDTDEEHAEVLRRGAERLKEIAARREQEQEGRRTNEAQSREAEEKWGTIPFAEVSYRVLLMAGGADETVSQSVDRLRTNLDLLKVVKHEKMGEISRGIDAQIRDNPNLTSGTKEKLMAFQKELLP